MYGGEANHGKPAGDIIPELSSPATFVEISQDRHRMFVGTVGYTNADRTFSKKRYLFPITTASSMPTPPSMTATRTRDGKPNSSFIK